MNPSLMCKADGINSLLYGVDKNTNLIEEIQDDMDTIDSIVTKQEKNLASGTVYTFESYEYDTTMYDFFIKKYNFNKDEIYTSNKVSSEDFNRYLPYMYKISIETGTNLWTKLVELIKALFNKIYNAMRMIYAKILTYLPIIENSITSLLGFLDANTDIPPKQISREDLRGVINKASAIFKVNKDVKDLEKLLNPINRVKLVASIGLAPITYGNAAIKDLTATNQELVDGSRRAAESIINTDYYSPYSNYNAILNKQDYDNYSNLVYRVDGRTIKYLTYYIDSNENGVPLLGYKLNNQYVTFEEENTLLLGKVYTPNDIKLLLRTTLSYLGSNRNFQSEVDKMIRNIKDIKNKLVSGSDIKTDGPASSVRRAIINNFYKLIKPVLSSISTDIVVGYLYTAKDIYNVSYKFANLWYDKSYRVSKEDDFFVGNYITPSVELYKGKGHVNKSNNEIFESPPSLYDIEANEELQKEHEETMPKNALGEPVEDVIKVDDDDIEVISNDQLVVSKENMVVSRENLIMGTLGIVMAVLFVIAFLAGAVALMWAANYIIKIAGSLIDKTIASIFNISGYLEDGSSAEVTLYFEIECPNTDPKVFVGIINDLFVEGVDYFSNYDIFEAVFEQDKDKLAKAIASANNTIDKCIKNATNKMKQLRSAESMHRVEVSLPGNIKLKDISWKSVPKFLEYIVNNFLILKWHMEDFKTGKSAATYLHESTDNWFNEEWPPDGWVDDNDIFIKGPWKGRDRVDVLTDKSLAEEIIKVSTPILDRICKPYYKWLKSYQSKLKVVKIGVVGCDETITGDEFFKAMSTCGSVLGNKSINKIFRK